MLYITLDSADEKPDDYDDGSVVPVYHYDAYDWNDLIPLESFESRSMNTIIRDVFDNTVFRVISIECNASR